MHIILRRLESNSYGHMELGEMWETGQVQPSHFVTEAREAPEVNPLYSHTAAYCLGGNWTLAS